MCFEFLYECKRNFIDEVKKIPEAPDFFLVCIGKLNYLYFNDNYPGEKIQHFFSGKGIALHDLPPEEMLGVLDYPETREYQVFYGSESLFYSFRTTTRH